MVSTCELDHSTRHQAVKWLVVRVLMHGQLLMACMQGEPSGDTESLRSVAKRVH
jgi:hypothetical protein